MQTRNKYEEMILKELKGFPIEALPHVVKILHSIKDSTAVFKPKKNKKSSGLCGIWKDVRDAEEIIKDIYSHRTGFGGREINL